MERMLARNVYTANKEVVTIITMTSCMNEIINCMIIVSNTYPGVKLYTAIADIQKNYYIVS